MTITFSNFHLDPAPGGIDLPAGYPTENFNPAHQPLPAGAALRFTLTFTAKHDSQYERLGVALRSVFRGEMKTASVTFVTEEVARDIHFRAGQSRSYEVSLVLDERATYFGHNATGTPTLEAWAEQSNTGRTLSSMFSETWGGTATYPLNLVTDAAAREAGGTLPLHGSATNGLFVALIIFSLLSSLVVLYSPYLLVITAALIVATVLYYRFRSRILQELGKLELRFEHLDASTFRVILDLAHGSHLLGEAEMSYSVRETVRDARRPKRTKWVTRNGKRERVTEREPVKYYHHTFYQAPWQCVRLEGQRVEDTFRYPPATVPLPRQGEDVTVAWPFSLRIKLTQGNMSFDYNVVVPIG